MWPWGASIAFSVLLIVASVLAGPASNAGSYRVLECLSGAVTGAGGGDCEIVDQIVFEVRLPRILLAFLVGAALGVSGSAFQALLKNPLVSPDILGLSSGAAFAAACAVLIPALPVQPAAFAGGLLAVSLSYFIARSRGGVSQLALLLSGVIVSGVFTALLSLVQYAADPFKLGTIVHWTMGNLHTADWHKLYSSMAGALPGIAVLLLMRWRLNVLSLGDDEARSSGVNVARERIYILLPAALAASSVVAVAGVIPLLALIVPHMARLIAGCDNRRVLPASLLLGGILMLLIDDITRTILDSELPVGVFTMIISAPVFIYLFKTRRLFFSSE